MRIFFALVWLALGIWLAYAVKQWVYVQYDPITVLYVAIWWSVIAAFFLGIAKAIIDPN
jgi:hypothetical protein